MSFSNRIALFIDGANLFGTSKALGFDIDFKQLIKEFASRGTLVRAIYYTAIAEDQEYSSVRPLVDWLDYNGYTVVTKAAKEYVDAGGRHKLRGLYLKLTWSLGCVEIIALPAVAAASV